MAFRIGPIWSATSWKWTAGTTFSITPRGMSHEPQFLGQRLPSSHPPKRPRPTPRRAGPAGHPLRVLELPSRSGGLGLVGDPDHRAVAAQYPRLFSGCGFGVFHDNGAMHLAKVNDAIPYCVRVAAGGARGK